MARIAPNNLLENELREVRQLTDPRKVLLPREPCLHIFSSMNGPLCANGSMLIGRDCLSVWQSAPAPLSARYGGGGFQHVWPSTQPMHFPERPKGPESADLALFRRTLAGNFSSAIGILARLTVTPPRRVPGRKSLLRKAGSFVGSASRQET